MEFVFPDLPKLSLWDLACRLTKQNATDERPSNDTRDKLRELIQAVCSNELWIEWPDGIAIDFATGFLPSALSGKVRTDWHSLDVVMVRRKDWLSYTEAARTSRHREASNRSSEAGDSRLTTTHVIQVPPGTEFISAGDIPNWVAGVLAPMPSSEHETVLFSLGKRYRVGEGQYVDCSLTPQDWNTLEVVWRNLPPVKDSTKETFTEYKIAFESMPNKPDWSLQEAFQNLHDQARARKSQIRFEHAMMIDSSIKNGTLHALTDTRTKADKLWLGVTVSIEDARNYLKPLGFELKENLTESEQHDFESPEGIVGWWDYTMDASFWWMQPTVSPQEAALLLCQLNPHQDGLRPEGHDNGETGAQEYKKLLRAFNGLQSVQEKHRTIEQWVCVAQRDGLKYHSWIDDYLLAVDALPSVRATPLMQLSKISQMRAGAEGDVPGAIPTKGAGRVAIAVAWALECKLDNRPTAKQVMARMRELANNGSEFTDVLRETPAIVQGVNWITGKGDARNYTMEALEAALARWNKSRQ